MCPDRDALAVADTDAGGDAAARGVDADDLAGSGVAGFQADPDVAAAHADRLGLAAHGDPPDDPAARRVHADQTAVEVGDPQRARAERGALRGPADTDRRDHPRGRGALGRPRREGDHREDEGDRGDRERRRAQRARPIPRARMERSRRAPERAVAAPALGRLDEIRAQAGDVVAHG